MDYAGMTLIELHGAWVQNWKAVTTGIQEIIGDAEMPSPRDVARYCSEMSEETWVGLFESESATIDLKKTMDLQKMLTEIQIENIAILHAAMNLGEKSD